MRMLRIALLMLVAAGFVAAQTSPANIIDCRLPAPVQLKQIGQPIWAL